MHIRRNKPHRGLETKISGELCGFTLVELMITVAIMALLATAAYPAYTESVRKAKRTEGRAALMQLMQQQERIYSQQNTYVAFSSVSANKDAFKWYSGDTPVASAYEISAAACPEESIGNCVQLTATPGTEKVDPNFQDTKCGPLSLTSTGKKLPATAGCWK